MGRRLAILAGLVGILAVVGAARAGEVHVIDGDTVELVDTKGTERIRLLNIDAPEIYRPECNAERDKGLLAAAELTRLLAGKTPAVARRGVDRYGRTLALLSVDGADLGEALVAAGHARPWNGRREDWCRG